MQYVFLIAIVVTIVFFAQFILSMLGSEFDMDSDIDMSIDSADGSGFDFSDVISFKGVVHFLIGSCWTLWLLGSFSVLTIGISIGVGLLFIYVLHLVYKYVNSLKSEPIRETPEDLIGRSGTIYYKVFDKCYMIQIAVNGLLTERTVMSKSGKEYHNGDVVEVIEAKHNSLYIE